MKWACLWFAAVSVALAQDAPCDPSVFFPPSDPIYIEWIRRTIHTRYSLNIREVIAERCENRERIQIEAVGSSMLPPVGSGSITYTGLGTDPATIILDGAPNKLMLYTNLIAGGPLNLSAGPGGFNVSGSMTLNQVGIPLNVNATLNPDGSFNGNLKDDKNQTEPINGQISTRNANTAGTNAFLTVDPVSTASGTLVSEFTADLDLGGGPLPVRFIRHYESFLNANGVSSALGGNWMHNFASRLYFSGTSAAVTMFPGAVVWFVQNNGVWQEPFASRRSYQLVQSGGNYRFLDPASNLVYTYTSSGDLIKIEDRNGNALMVTPSPNGPIQVSDNLGRTLAFAYDSNGKLTKVQDQSGRTVTFSHTVDDLTGVTAADGTTTTFSYATASPQKSLMVKSTRANANTPYTQAYDSFGRVVKQSDSLGNNTTLSYNSGTTVVTDPNGNASTYVYPNLLDLASSKDAAGNTSKVTYDSARRPITFTDRLGNTRTLTYGPSGDITSATDELGNRISVTYSAQSQNGLSFYIPAKAQFPDSTSESYSYDSLGNLTGRTDRAGKIWNYTYNSRGQVLTATNPSGGTTTYTYNTDGTVASTKSPAGDVTAYAYDNLKRRVKITYADGTSRSSAWDALDRLVSSTDERGNTSTFAYDANGNLLTATDPLKAAATWAYDTDDLLSKASDPLGNAAKPGYDALGNMTSSTNPAGEKSSFNYDSLYRVKSAADPAGKASSFGYDNEGRLTAATDALGNTANFTMDKRGLPTSAATPMNESYSYTYDSLRRLTSSTNPLNQKSSFSYDQRGLLAGITLADGSAASYSRNELGLLAGITDANGNAWTRSYDNMGRLSAFTDPLNRTTSLTRDQRNRISSVTHPQGSVQASYDPAGNLIRLLYSDGTDLRFTYDADNRLIGANNVTLTLDADGRIVNSNGLALTYDAASRIASIAYPPGNVTYSRDARGLVTQVADWRGQVTSLAYDDAQRMISITRPNGVVTQYTYDRDSRIASITETGGGQMLASIALTYDAAGRTLAADRNFPQMPSLAAGMLPLSYDAAHQLTSGTSDGIGRLTSDPLGTYTWDLASRMTSYARADGSASFSYDDLGLRIARTASGVTQNYILNYALGLPSVAVVQSGGADLRYYIYLPDGSLLYSVEAADSSSRYFHFDEIGSTVMLTDDSGNITDSYGITPYGETVTHSGTSDNPFTFVGRWGVMQEGQTSLYYMRNRYYDSATARFDSRDPVASIDPRELSQYQYAVGNPLSFIDPMGLKEGRLKFISGKELFQRYYALERDILQGNGAESELMEMRRLLPQVTTGVYINNELSDLIKWLELGSRRYSSWEPWPENPPDRPPVPNLGDGIFTTPWTGICSACQSCLKRAGFVHHEGCLESVEPDQLRIPETPEERARREAWEQRPLIR